MQIENTFFAAVKAPGGYWCRAMLRDEEIIPITLQGTPVQGAPALNAFDSSSRWHLRPLQDMSQQFVKAMLRTSEEYFGHRLYVSFVTIPGGGRELCIRLEFSQADTELELMEALDRVTRTMRTLFDPRCFGIATQDWTIEAIEKTQRNAFFLGMARLLLGWEEVYAVDQLRRWVRYEREHPPQEAKYHTDISSSQRQEYGIDPMTVGLMVQAALSASVPKPTSP